MAARTAASEFLCTKPQTRNSERYWLNHQRKKTDIYIDVVPSRCPELAYFSLDEESVVQFA